MKRAFVLVTFLLSALAAQAQSTNATPTKPEASAQVQLPAPAPPSRPFAIKQAAPNEIISGKVSYDGVGVQIAKSRAPLQLFNPITPPKDSSADQNVARDPINGRVNGLKVFAFHF